MSCFGAADVQLAWFSFFVGCGFTLVVGYCIRWYWVNDFFGREDGAGSDRDDGARKRATAGVCPVKECHRHFTNLERHMGTKHPDFQERDIG